MLLFMVWSDMIHRDGRWGHPGDAAEAWIGEAQPQRGRATNDG